MFQLFINQLKMCNKNQVLKRHLQADAEIDPIAIGSA